MGSVKQVQVTFDCAEPVRVGKFWCEVLGYVGPADHDDDSWYAASDPSGVGPRLFFPPSCPTGR